MYKQFYYLGLAKNQRKYFDILKLCIDDATNMCPIWRHNFVSNPKKTARLRGIK